MGRSRKDERKSSKKSKRSRSRSRSRSRERPRERSREKKAKSREPLKEAVKPLAATAAVAAATTAAAAAAAEEQKKLERAEAWKKARVDMMREVVAESAPVAAGTAAAKGGMVIAAAAAVAAPTTPVAASVQNMFGEDDDAGRGKVADPSRVFGGAALPVVATGQQEDDDDERKEEAKDGGAEPDELDVFMTGIQAEHQKLLREGPEMVRTAAQVGDEAGEGDEDEAVHMLGGSDDELFLAVDAGKKKVLEAVDHSIYAYAPFNKDFYIETESIRRMSEVEVRALRKRLDHIKVRGKDCPKPITKFTEAGLSDGVLKIMEAAGFETPTPIQAQALPAVMSGRDVIGIAKTGSGKTLAYLLPMLRHIADQPPVQEREGPIALILVPTRELCMQIAQEVKRFKQVRAVAVYGGSDVSCQIGNLKRGCEIVVATPGRLIDILTLNSGKITNLRRVTYLVLDEADRMFDMGFAPQISKLIDNVRPQKQAVMFSATFPTSVETLARRALKNPVEIVVGGRLQVCGDVDQRIEVCREDMKFPLLLQAMGEWSPKGQILIFTDRQEAVDTLYRKLMDAGYSSMTLHGGKDQLDRISTISDFKSGLENVMIATSVAARGLDVRNLVLVVNYDVPNHIEDYVHRVGRTGRAGRKGTAITLVTPDEERYAPALAKALTESGKEVPAKLQELVAEHQRKVEAGLVADHRNNGYKTSGFKFTEKEAKDKRRLEMATYGIDIDNSSSDGDGSEGDEEHGAVTVGGARKNVESMTPEELLQMIDDDPIRKVSEEALKIAGLVKEPLSVEDAARQQAQRTAEQQAAAVGGGLKRAADIAKALALRGTVAAAAAAAQAAAEGGAEDTTKYQAEIPINEFPQQVRFKVSNKETVDGLVEMFPGVAITVKGTYVAPGRKPMPGERKLYVELVGFQELNVRLCKREIVRIMKETAAAQVGLGVQKDRYAKYSLV
jgi:ATP-dependent RNA helicase DDX46/PRP5